MLLPVKNGQTSNIIRVKLLDSSSATGAGLTGLTSASSGLIISTIADVEASATAYTVAASHIQTITTLGTFAAPSASNCRFKEVDSTNHPGIYEIQIADARFAVSNAKSLLISISGATNLKQCDVLVPLWVVDPYGVPAVNVMQIDSDTNVAGYFSQMLNTGDPGTFTADFRGSTFPDFATALLDLTNGVETGVTPRQALRAIASGIGGKVTVTGSVYAAIGNTGTPRLTVTDDGSGNRSVTLSL